MQVIKQMQQYLKKNLANLFKSPVIVNIFKQNLSYFFGPTINLLSNRACPLAFDKLLRNVFFKSTRMLMDLFIR